jgi:AcrR family transcriptional regulator
MTLTAKGRATRQRIIDGAAAYLLSDEPGEVTLDDIRAVTKTSKGQLFHYFPGGKEELLLTVAKFEASRVLADQQPHLGALDSWAAWDAWLLAVIGRYRAQGTHCPLSSLMNQVGSVPGAAEVVTTLLETWQGHLRRGIIAMQERGLIGGSVDPERTSAAFITGIQGGVSVLRSTGSTAHLEATLSLLMEYLQQGGRQLAMRTAV